VEAGNVCVYVVDRVDVTLCSILPVACETVPFSLLPTATTYCCFCYYDPMHAN
jgi:hypothetical protein